MTKEEIELELAKYKSKPVIMPIVTKELGGIVKQVDQYVANEVFRHTIYDLVGVVLKLGGAVTAMSQEYVRPTEVEKKRKRDSQDTK